MFVHAASELAKTEMWTYHAYAVGERNGGEERELEIHDGGSSRFGVETLRLHESGELRCRYWSTIETKFGEDRSI